MKKSDDAVDALPYAIGVDLDRIGKLYDVERTPGAKSTGVVKINGAVVEGVSMNDAQLRAAIKQRLYQPMSPRFDLEPAYGFEALTPEKLERAKKAMRETMSMYGQPIVMSPGFLREIDLTFEFLETDEQRFERQAHATLRAVKRMRRRQRMARKARRGYP